MQLDDVQAVIRPRSAWEATDLGMLMAVRWWRPMLKAWLAVTLPVYVLLLFIPGEAWVGPLIFWWLKPLWERIHLHIVSRALFGEVPGVVATLRAFPKLLPPRIFASLLWGRLNPYRSMDAPVTQLEGLRGARYRQRVRLLHAEDDAPARYLLMAGAGVETLLFLAAGLLLELLVPSELESTVGAVFAASDGTFIVALESVLMYLSITLVAPFYVAGGFALYLNRRVKLEAWDIEIAFRKLAAAHAHRTATLAKVALLVLACGLPLAVDDTVYAAEPASDAARSEALGAELDAAGALAEEVMTRAEFHDIAVRQTPQMDPGLADTLSRWLERLLDFLGRDARPRDGALFAQAVEVLLWSALFGIIAMLVWHYRNWLRAFAQPRRAAATGFALSHAAPAAAGIDPSNTVLPDDVAAACRALWQRDEKLEAVALLYRAALVVFMRAYRFEFPESTTEGEHLARVRATLPPEATAWFIALSRMWLFIAYGKRAPEEAELLALCDSWQRDWEQAVQQQARGSAP